MCSVPTNLLPSSSASSEALFSTRLASLDSGISMDVEILSRSRDWLSTALRSDSNAGSPFGKKRLSFLSSRIRPRRMCSESMVLLPS